MFCPSYSRGSPFTYAPSYGHGYGYDDYDLALARQHALEQRRREAILLARQREREEAEQIALLRAQAHRRDQAERRRRAIEEQQARQAYFAEIEAAHRRQHQHQQYQQRQRQQQQQLVALQRIRFERAARIIQRAIRSHLAAKPRHHELDRIASDFGALSLSFQWPDVTDLVLTDNGSLAFVAANAPLRAHEEALIRMLTRLDAVDSAGDVRVRDHRRSTVLAIERELERIEALKAAARDAHARRISAPMLVDTPADLSSAVEVPIDEPAAPVGVDAAAHDGDADMANSASESVSAPEPVSIAADIADAHPAPATSADEPVPDVAVAASAGEPLNLSAAAQDDQADTVRPRSPSLHSVSSAEEDFEVVD